MLRRFHWLLFASFFFVRPVTSIADPAPVAPVQNVILVTTDGLRWQEVFRGADDAYLNREQGVTDVAALAKDFGRGTPAERRAALLPFFWGTIAKEGQVFGNRDRKSDARLTNGMKFSYPGYNEILTGAPGPEIKSNDKVLNKNVTVLEWLNRGPAFAGRVAAACEWDRFPYIINSERSGVPVTGTAEHDSETFEVALACLKEKKPRVFYVAFGETDEHAHERRYDLVLRSARAVDGYVRALWEATQAMPEYAGKTALLMTTDHGRGGDPEGWKDHGEKVAGAEFIWIAALGPGIRPLGERADIPEVTQSQVAATAAALLGEDYGAAFPKAGKPIGDVTGR